MGRRVLHTGELGSASILKVVTNYLATANLVTCCEALVVSRMAGMDLNVAYEAIKISSGTSFVPRPKARSSSTAAATSASRWILWQRI